MIFCSTCGAELDDSDKFCWACGSTVKQRNRGVNQGDATPTQPADMNLPQTNVVQQSPGSVVQQPPIVVSQPQNANSGSNLVKGIGAVLAIAGLIIGVLFAVYLGTEGDFKVFGYSNWDYHYHDGDDIAVGIIIASGVCFLIGICMLIACSRSNKPQTPVTPKQAPSVPVVPPTAAELPHGDASEFEDDGGFPYRCSVCGKGADELQRVRISAEVGWADVCSVCARKYQ